MYITDHNTLAVYNCSYKRETIHAHKGVFTLKTKQRGVRILKKTQLLEVRTDDDRMLCKAQQVEGDILLIMKSAGKETSVRYTEIPRLVSLAKERQDGQKKSGP